MNTRDDHEIARECKKNTSSEFNENKMRNIIEKKRVFCGDFTNWINISITIKPFGKSCTSSGMLCACFHFCAVEQSQSGRVIEGCDGVSLWEWEPIIKLKSSFLCFNVIEGENLCVVHEKLFIEIVKIAGIFQVVSWWTVFELYRATNFNLFI